MKNIERCWKGPILFFNEMKGINKNIMGAANGNV
jgi:hypothetical protein